MFDQTQIVQLQTQVVTNYRILIKFILKKNNFKEWK
jgi:hypothetical protein